MCYVVPISKYALPYFISEEEETRWLAKSNILLSIPRARKGSHSFVLTKVSGLLLQ